MILDYYGTIDSVSENLAEKLFLTPHILEKLKINILLLSPTLARYFYYGKFLK